MTMGDTVTVRTFAAKCMQDYVEEWVIRACELLCDYHKCTNKSGITNHVDTLFIESDENYGIRNKFNDMNASGKTWSMIFLDIIYTPLSKLSNDEYEAIRAERWTFKRTLIPGLGSKNLKQLRDPFTVREAEKKTQRRMSLLLRSFLMFSITLPPLSLQLKSSKPQHQLQPYSSSDVLLSKFNFSTRYELRIATAASSVQTIAALPPMGSSRDTAEQHFTHMISPVSELDVGVSYFAGFDYLDPIPLTKLTSTPAPPPLPHPLLSVSRSPIRLQNGSVVAGSSSSSSLNIHIDNKFYSSSNNNANIINNHNTNSTNSGGQATASTKKNPPTSSIINNNIQSVKDRCSASGESHSQLIPTKNLDVLDAAPDERASSVGNLMEFLDINNNPSTSLILSKASPTPRAAALLSVSPQSQLINPTSRTMHDLSVSPVPHAPPNSNVTPPASGIAISNASPHVGANFRSSPGPPQQTPLLVASRLEFAAAAQRLTDVPHLNIENGDQEANPAAIHTSRTPDQNNVYLEKMDSIRTPRNTLSSKYQHQQGSGQGSGSKYGDLPSRYHSFSQGHNPHQFASPSDLTLLQGGGCSDLMPPLSLVLKENPLLETFGLCASSSSSSSSTSENEAEHSDGGAGGSSSGRKALDAIPSVAHQNLIRNSTSSPVGSHSFKQHNTGGALKAKRLGGGAFANLITPAPMASTTNKSSVSSSSQYASPAAVPSPLPSNNQISANVRPVPAGSLRSRLLNVLGLLNLTLQRSASSGIDNNNNNSSMSSISLSPTLVEHLKETISAARATSSLTPGFHSRLDPTTMSAITAAIEPVLAANESAGGVRTATLRQVSHVLSAATGTAPSATLAAAFMTVRDSSNNSGGAFNNLNSGDLEAHSSTHVSSTLVTPGGLVHERTSSNYARNQIAKVDEDEDETLDALLKSIMDMTAPANSFWISPSANTPSSSTQFAANWLAHHSKGQGGVVSVMKKGDIACDWERSANTIGRLEVECAEFFQVALS